MARAGVFLQNLHALMVKQRGAWLLLLVLLWQQQQEACCVKLETAYLVQSLRQPYDSLNSSYDSLSGILSSPHGSYGTIILTEDYEVAPREFASDPVRLAHDLLITSPLGQRYQLSLAFLDNAVLLNNHTVTLRSIAINQARKTSGQSLPFFSGEGVVWMQDCVRQRIVCSSNINATVTTLSSTPRPPGFPGTQQVSVIDYLHRGKVYADSVHMQDVVVFVSPGDVEDVAYYAGSNVVQVNVTRVCDNYVPASCKGQCTLQAVDDILAAQASGDGSKQRQVLAILVPALVVPIVVLLATALGVYLWHRKRKAAQAARLLEQQQAQEKLHAQLEEGGAGGFGPGGSGLDRSQGGRGKKQFVPNRPGGSVGLLGHPLDMGAVGSIEEVALGPAADSGMRRGWHLLACHSAPEFPEATAKDTITLGVLLGAGSFGRVYKGRWRGMDVAVKVLHHDAKTAASVANEVDLVMSFRHPNITTAFHFLTWNYSHDTGDAHTSGSNGMRTSPDVAAAAGTAGSSATAAAAAAAVAGGGSSSAAGPATPRRERQLAPAPSDPTCSEDLMAVACSRLVPDASLAVIHSRSASSSTALKTSSAGTSSARDASPLQQRAPGPDAAASAGHAAAAAAAAAAGSVQPWSLQAAQVGPSSGRPATSGSHAHSKLQLDHDVTTLPLLQSLDSPHGTRANAGAPGGWGGAGRAALGVGSPSYGGFIPGIQADHTALQDQQQQQQQRPLQQGPSEQPGGAHNQQQELQLMQQEFVPMVPVSVVLPGGAGQADRHQGQQLQRYVPLMAPQQPQQQQQPRPQHGSASSTPSTLSNPQHLSGQLAGLQQQQLARAGRFDTGSGSSSYVGGGRSRPGEAQTWLILEFCDAGTLLDLMQDGLLLSSESGQPNLAHVLTLLADVAAGMNYLHLRNCVHGDLKPANVLLRKQQGAPFGHVAKVSDFGLSKSLTAGQSHRSTRTLGTFNRAPPELLRLGRLSPACDVYAYGVMIWELFTGEVAFCGLHYGEVFERVALQQERPPVPPNMPPELAALMVTCWNADPMARPTFRMIQQSLADMLRSLPDSGDRFVSDL